MFNSIFFKSLWERRKSTLVWAMSLFGFTLFYIYLFDSIAADYDEIFKEIPAAFEALVGEFDQISTPEGWLGIELFSLFLPISLAIITTGYGAGTIGKEEESGTIELLLSSPISRGRIMLEKIGGMVVVSWLVAMSVFVGILVGSFIFPFDISLVNSFWATSSAWLLGLVFGSFALAIQTLSKKRTIALGASVAVLIFTYFANTISGVVDWLEPMRYASPFYYYDGQDVLSNGPNFVNLAILVFGFSALYVFAHWSFKKRDVGV